MRVKREVIGFIFVLAVLIGLFLIIAASTPVVNDPDKNEEEYKFGEKFHELDLKKPEDIKKLGEIVRDKGKVDIFLKGFKSTNYEKNLEKLLDSFFEYNDGKNILPDLTKTILSKKLSKEKGFTRAVAIFGFTNTVNRYQGAFDGIPDFDNDYEFNIDGENLVWKGNKWGVVDEKGNLVSWVDFDNVPRWTRKIEITKEGVFNMGFNTGNALKKAIFTEGTIGPAGDVIGPDGNFYGVHFEKNVQSIEIKDKKIKVTYKYPTKDGINEQSIEIGIDDIGDNNFNKILKLFNGEGKISKEKINQFFSKIGTLGVDLRGPGASEIYGVHTDNRVNILYGGNPGSLEDDSLEEIIHIDHDAGKGRVTIKGEGENEATVVTTNSVGDVNLLVRKGEGRDKDSTYTFSKSGDILSVKNAFFAPYEGEDNLVALMMTTPIDKEIGVNLERNALIAAAFSGDKARIASIVAEKTINEILAGTGGVSGIDQKILSEVKELLKDPTLAPALKAKLTDLQIGLENQFRASTRSIVDLIFPRLDNARLGVSNPVKEYYRDTAVTIIEKSAEVILSDPEKLKILLKGNEQEINKVVKGVLNDMLSSFTNSPTPLDFTFDENRNIEKIKKIVNLGALLGVNNIDLSKSKGGLDIINSLNDFIKSPSGLVSVIDSGLGGALNEDEKKALGELFTTIRNNGESLLNDIRGDRSEFGSSITIDLQKKRVVYDGREAGTTVFNSLIPLTEVRVDGQTQGSEFVLSTNNNLITKINGGQIQVANNIDPYLHWGIDRIKVDKSELTLDVNPLSGEYSMYDPRQLTHGAFYGSKGGSQKVFLWSAGATVRAIEIEIVGRLDSDYFGGDPESELILRYIAGPDTISTHTTLPRIFGIADMASGQAYSTALSQIPRELELSMIFGDATGEAQRRFSAVDNAAGNPQLSIQRLNEARNFLSNFGGTDIHRGQELLDQIDTAINRQEMYQLLDILNKESIRWQGGEVRVSNKNGGSITVDGRPIFKKVNGKRVPISDAVRHQFIDNFRKQQLEKAGGNFKGIDFSELETRIL